MTCLAHPQEPILGPCDRCGSFVCKLDSVEKEAKRYCADCAQRFGADWLQAYKAEMWGKRDGWAYLYGVVGTLGYLLLSVALVVAVSQRGASDPAGFGMLAVSLAGAAVSVGYFLGRRLARFGVIALPLLPALVVVPFEPGAAGGLLAQAILPVAFGLAAFFGDRNRLFFKIDVPEKRLRRMWDIYRNNQYARSGFLLSFLGLLIPGLCLISGLLSTIGYFRVDPDAHPPIGRKGYAIAGIVLSIVGAVWWTLVFAVGLG